MTTEVFSRCLFSLILSLALAWMVFDRSEDSTGFYRQRYLPYISGALLPVCILTLTVCSLLLFDAQTAMDVILGFCFGVFLHICLYYLLLLPALPLLRRHISARACAVLWMLPNYLYLTQMTFMSLPGPRWVIEVPTALVWTLFLVWLAGFLGVLGWKTLSHLTFRRGILRDASPVIDPQILTLWQQEVDAARFVRPKFRLVTSPNVQTPLSVGLFKRSIRVVLPQRDYTPQELTLIFRHELIHIGREDSWNKFFLVFCTAMCWFYPPMWAAMKRSAEDLELSCDETVLLEAGEEIRRQYADLLLRTAGDERGFTSCLSASADALHYRLKSVVSPVKKPSGALAVALSFFLLCISCGYVAPAYGEDTGAELIYQSHPLEASFLRSIRWKNDPYDAQLLCTDEEVLHRYLASLPMKRVAGNYTFQSEEKYLVLLLDTPQGIQGVSLCDNSVRLSPLYGRSIVSSYYYLPESPDWDVLSRCIFECPALNVRLSGQTEDHHLSATLCQASLLGERDDRLLYQREDKKAISGIYGSSLFSQAQLSFNFPPMGNVSAEVIAQQGDSYTVLLEGASAILPLPDSPFRCTVRGDFQREDGTACRAEFQFEVGTL